MNEKKTLNELKSVLEVSEAWFLKYGEVNPDGHKQLKEMLKGAIKGLKHLEYMVDLYHRKIEVTVYLGAWRMMFSKTKKIAENIVELLEECLHDYEIVVKIKRYRGDNETKKT